MPKQAAWAQTMKVGNKEVPVHMTIIGRRLAPQTNQQPSQSSSFYDLRPMLPGGYSQNSIQPQQPMQSGRMTGYGVDGQLQPGKMAGQVHEGEGVIPANAMQAISTEEFNQLNNAASSGQLNKNLFRQSIGLPPIQGYQEGGVVRGRYTDPYERREENPEGVTSQPPTETQQEQPPGSIYRDRTVDPYGRRGSNYTPQPGMPTIPEKVEPEVIKAPTIQQTTDSGPSSYVKPPELKKETFQPEPVQFKVPDAYQPIQTTTTVQQPTLPEKAEPQVVLPQTPQLQQQATTTTPTTTQTTGMSAQAQDVVKQALNSLKQQMSGMSPADQKIMNYYLTNTDASDAANLRVLEHQISSDPTMSEQGKQMAVLGVQREMNAIRSNLSNQLATNAAERAGAAATSAGALGQQVRSYEDVTLPTTDMTLRTAEENLRQAQQTYDNYTTEANRIALETAKQQLNNLKTQTGQSAEDSINNRISMLMTQAGATPQTIASDKILNDLISQYYGGTVTPEQVANEIGVRVSTLTEQNKAQYAANAETLMADALNTGKTMEQVVADPSIRQAVNGLLGGNATDQQITDEIAKRYAEVSKSDVNVAIENIVRSGLVDDYATYNTTTGEIEEVFPGFLNDMEAVYKDLMLNGAIDPDTGMPKADAVYSWPWDDPSTYFKYNDWSGNPISPGSSMGNQAIINPDTGTAYLDGSGNSITNAAATAKWDKLGLGIKEQYYADAYDSETGTLDYGIILKKLFPTVTGENGETIPITTSDEIYQKYLTDSTYRNRIGTIQDAFKDSTIITEDIAKQLGEEQFLGLEGQEFSFNYPDSFLYYDENGVLKMDSIDSNKFVTVVQQLSDLKNDGVIFDDVKQFNAVWQNGKGWYLDSDGNLTNVDNEGVNPKVAELVPKFVLLTSNPDSFEGNLSNDDMYIISQNWDEVPAELKASHDDGYIESIATITRHEGSGGLNRWVLTTDANKWARANVGKLYRSENDGRIYQVVGPVEYEGFNTTAGIKFKDWSTGEEVFYSYASGSKSDGMQQFTGEPYAS